MSGENESCGPSRSLVAFTVLALAALAAFIIYIEIEYERAVERDEQKQLLSTKPKAEQKDTKR